MPTRRDFLLATAVVTTFGCVRRAPETPLAHLHGRAWVTGAYSHYAEAYLNVERGARARSFDAYKLLAQKGITALDALQRREVPFYVRVADDASGFRVERQLPERLTFSAEMTPAERERATRAWKLAREHIHTDYEEIQRLDFALGALLAQVSRVRHAVDEGRAEQFRLVRQLGTLDSGGSLPFELPYQVSRDDYHSVLLLLLARIEADRERLRHTEAAIVAVGLCARATDARCASLSSNVKKVLLGVVRDAADEPPGAAYPERDDERAPLLQRARQLSHGIAQSAEYRAWLAARLEEEDALGKLLMVLDSMTGLPTSNVYRQVMRIWRGGGDYLDYLKLAVSILPSGSGVGSTLRDASERTESYRREVQKLGGAAELAKRLASDGGSGYGGALLNVATEHSRRKLDRQLAFFADAEEEQRVAAELAETALAKDPLPAVPRRAQ